MANAAGVIPELPPLCLRHCEPDRREPGTVLFNVRAGGVPGVAGGLAGWLLALGQSGEIRCIFRAEQAVQCARPLANGNLLVSIADGLRLEMTLAGEILRRWYATGRYRGQAAPANGIPIEAETLHHGASLTADGNMLLASMEVREFDGWPGSVTDPDAPRERSRLVGDIILEVRPDGTKVAEHRLLDILDPYRITYGSRRDYWVKKGFAATNDWCHLNAIFHDVRDNSLLISLRTQDCMIKIDRRTGALKWILGSPKGWRKPYSESLLEPIGPIEWNFHQHDVSITPAGTVLCFDNGNHRAIPFDPPLAHEDNTSRAVEFAVDEETRTVRQVWSFGEEAPHRLFAGFQGGAIRLPSTGNTFITYGGICSIAGKPVDEPDDADICSRLVEVTPDKRIVLDLTVGGGAGDPKVLSVFRAMHTARDLWA